MYGKTFASMYTGSMMGAGPDVFAIWNYCIGCKSQRGVVELNPNYLAVIIGKISIERVHAAIDYLCAPDASSRSALEDGRRLLKLDGFEYLVVTHEKYAKLGSKEARAAYMADLMRNKRASEKQTADGPEGALAPVSTRKQSLAMLAHKYVDKDVDKELTTLVPSERPEPTFADAWRAYPKRAGGNSRKAAHRAWNARIRSGEDPTAMLDGVERYARYIRAMGQESTIYVKMAATFFGPDEHWKDAHEIPASGNSRSRGGTRAPVDDALVSSMESDPSLGTRRV